MSLVLLDAGFLAVSIRHSLLKNGVYFYYRRIPEDLRGHYSMRDRLRHVGAPVDIQDAIGGWGSKTVGMGYGEGYRLEQLRDYLEKVVLE